MVFVFGFMAWICGFGTSATLLANVIWTTIRSLKAEHFIFEGGQVTLIWFTIFLTAGFLVFTLLAFIFGARAVTRF